MMPRNIGKGRQISSYADGAIGVQADGNFVDQSGKFRQDVAFVDDVAMPVGIEPYASSGVFDFFRDFFDRVEAQRGFAESAEHDLFVFQWIIDRLPHFFVGRFAVELEVITLHDRIGQSGAEGAIVGASIC